LSDFATAASGPPTISEAVALSVLEAAPDAIVTIDQAGRIVLVNAQTERLFGYDRQELLGRPIETLLPERFHSVHVTHRNAYARAPCLRPMGIGLELYGRHRDGTEFPVEISLSPIETAAGRLVTSAIRDVTDRKRIEEQFKQQTDELARSNAELQQFAYVASHDLQEPLRMVSSYTQLLARRYQGKLDSDADEFIAFAVDGAQRMQDLIQDLLLYSRVGTRGRAFERTDCNAIVDHVLGDLSAAIVEARATVIRDDLPTVLGDAVQLGQLFLNLIGNAIKFRGAEPPNVHVSARHNHATWLFSVRDNGIGIEPQYVDRVFIIFQRLHGIGKYPGTGIGLAICKKIVERHGGRIWIESAPGEGTTFFFTIPERR
jgi:PAS domain S-box-containing protein